MYDIAQGAYSNHTQANDTTFERYAEQDHSIQRLVEELDELGFRSKPHRRNALPWPLAKNEVHKMLRNRYYLGKVIYKGQEYPENTPNWFLTNCS